MRKIPIVEVTPNGTNTDIIMVPEEDLDGFLDDISDDYDLGLGEMKANYHSELGALFSVSGSGSASAKVSTSASTTAKPKLPVGTAKTATIQTSKGFKPVVTKATNIASNALKSVIAAIPKAPSPAPKTIVPSALAKTEAVAKAVLASIPQAALAPAPAILPKTTSPITAALNFALPKTPAAAALVTTPVVTPKPVTSGLGLAPQNKSVTPAVTVTSGPFLAVTPTKTFSATATQKITSPALAPVLAAKTVPLLPTVPVKTLTVEAAQRLGASTSPTLAPIIAAKTIPPASMSLAPVKTFSEKTAQSIAAFNQDTSKQIPSSSTAGKSPVPAVKLPDEITKSEKPIATLMSRLSELQDSSTCACIVARKKPAKAAIATVHRPVLQKKLETYQQPANFKDAVLGHLKTIEENLDAGALKSRLQRLIRVTGVGNA